MISSLGTSTPARAGDRHNGKYAVFSACQKTWLFLKVTRYFYLALPLGELSAKLTERVCIAQRNDNAVRSLHSSKKFFVGNGRAVPFLCCFAQSDYFAVGDGFPVPYGSAGGETPPLRAYVRENSLLFV